MNSPTQGEETNMHNNGPSIEIFACGGAGINIMNSFNGDVNYIRLDTSFANIKEGQNVIILSRKAEGGGKIRVSNSSEIDENIKALNDVHSDINILLYSSSGASGSVIGPLLNKYINSYGKKIINCIIVSDDSEIEIQNSLNTIKSLDAIAKKENIFMPIILLKNTNKYSQKELNEIIAKHVENIYNFFNINTLEIDKNDRLNFISDNEHSCGLRPMNFVCSKVNKNDKDSIDDILICNKINNNNDIVLFHSYMGIGHLNKNGDKVYPIPDFNNKEMSDISIKTKYEGVQVVDSTSSYISVIFPTDMLLKELIQDLETKLLKFENLKAKNKDSLFDNNAEVDATGLVF